MAWCGRIAPFHLAAGVFLWILGLGLLLQLVVLPILLPGIHAGHGLIAGGDWLSFHRLATRKAEEIAETGWSAWELRPESQSPAGIASVLYHLFLPTPLVVLPLNALVFAIATVAARSLLTTLTGNRGAATLGILPFLLFPSFLMVWGQIHKDVFSGAGSLVVLAALAAAARGRGRIAGIAAAVAAGGTLIWIARAYALEIVTGASLVFLVTLAVCRARFFWRAAVSVLVLVGTAALLTTMASGIGKGMLRGATTATAVEVPPVDAASAQPLSPAQMCAPEPSANPLDRVLFSLCRERQHFLQWHPEAGSNLDADTRMRTLPDFLLYLPRAIQIAVLFPSPVPTTERTSEIGQVGRAAVAFEMAVAYAAFALALLLAWRALLRPPVLATIFFALSYILVHVYALPNMGTLYRMRIFMFTALVAVALALALAAWLDRPGADGAPDTRKP